MVAGFHILIFGWAVSPYVVSRTYLLRRDWPGIHTRVGGNMLGLTMGEDVAISLLTDPGFTYTEPTFNGFTLTKFDGTTVLVEAKQTVGTTGTTATTACAV